MASEFDDALQNFLDNHGLHLEVYPSEHGGFFDVRLIETRRVGSRWEDRQVGEGTGESLDDAINDAVDRFASKLRQEGGVVSDWRHSGDGLEPNAERCPCENEACERLGLHRPGECPHQADPELQVEYLGALCPGCYERMPEEYRKNDDEGALEPNRVWTTRYKNSLPDSAFLYVRPNCVEHKDAQGRSHPLDCRDLPVKNRAGNYDYAHVKNAISRAVQLQDVPMSVQRKLQAKARAIFKREFGGSED
jgi:hypothetical protein